MRLLVDECTGQTVAAWLRERGHEVFSVFDEDRGMTDEAPLAKAAAENWVVITNDKDFGTLVFREKRPHKGIIFLRLDDERTVN
jgi:predicted nuclease of predicted toxin-antitoxin system